MAAIEHAMRVLDWQENLLGDEMPPAWMWPLDSELQVWFDEVERNREERYGSRSSSSDSDDDKVVPLMSNALAEGRR